jgi:hypothetical protein
MGIDYAWINLPKNVDNVIDLYASAGKATHAGVHGNKWKLNFNYALKPSVSVQRHSYFPSFILFNFQSPICVRINLSVGKPT